MGAEGIATEHALASSRLFSVDTVSIYLVVLNDGSARFLGPPMGRAAVARGGQSGYAFQQLIICLFVFLGSLGIRCLISSIGKNNFSLKGTCPTTADGANSPVPSSCPLGRIKEQAVEHEELASNMIT